MIVSFTKGKDFFVICDSLKHVSYSQVKSDDQEKSGNITFQSRGKLRQSKKVSQFKSSMVQNLTNTQKN